MAGQSIGRAGYVPPNADQQHMFMGGGTGGVGRVTAGGGGAKLGGGDGLNQYSSGPSLGAYGQQQAPHALGATNQQLLDAANAVATSPQQQYINQSIYSNPNNAGFLNSGAGQNPNLTGATYQQPAGRTGPAMMANSGAGQQFGIGQYGNYAAKGQDGSQIPQAAAQQMQNAMTVKAGYNPQTGTLANQQQPAMSVQNRVGGSPVGGGGMSALRPGGSGGAPAPWWQQQGFGTGPKRL